MTTHWDVKCTLLVIGVPVGIGFVLGLVAGRFLFG
jgi:hypothetical protein